MHESPCRTADLEGGAGRAPSCYWGPRTEAHVVTRLDRGRTSAGGEVGRADLLTIVGHKMYAQRALARQEHGRARTPRPAWAPARLHPPNPRPRRRRLPHLGGGRRLQSGPGSGPGLVGGRRGVEHGLGLEPSRSHGGNRAAAGTSGYDASVDYVVVEHLSVDVADGVASLVVAAVIGLTRLHGVRPLTRCAAHRRSGGRWTGCRSDGSGAAVRSRPHVGLRGGRVVVQIDRPTHEARMSPLGPP